jgi:uncharacterized protein (DUF362 family)
MLNRRAFLIGSLAATSSVLLLKRWAKPSPLPRWEKGAYRKQSRSRVAVLSAKSYETSLKDVVLSGIKLFGLNVHGKTVVLKPNLVEYDPAGVINTHPAVIAATIEAFRSLGAREVTVAESSGHRRDTEFLLTASGLYSVLQEYQASYIDLDYDDTRPLKTQSRFTGLSHLWLPETILKADLLVNMPKLKTHRWAGVTLGMKNLFGIMPGAVYGWPKNILHQVGIPNSIIDINSTLAVQQFTIIDGIVGMDGYGPIQGDAKYAGVLICGDDTVAVDATAARLMKIEPLRVDYIEQAGRFLGNLREEYIVQVGESLDTFQQDFRVIPSFQYLKSFAV